MSSLFESETIDHVHSGCFLFKDIERDMKVEPKDDFPNNKLQAKNDRSSRNEFELNTVDHAQYS